MISLDRLNEVLDYDPLTGIFRWKVYIAGTSGIGNIAGSLENTGYRRIQIDGERYQEHILAWFYMKGKWPKTVIDHENRTTNDNRWINIREAEHFENNANSRLYSTNTSGFRGVSWHKKQRKWIASIRKMNKLYYIGAFDDKFLAAKAYDEEAIKYFGQYYKSQTD